MAEALVFVVLQKIAATIGDEVVKARTSKLFNQEPILRKIQYNIKQIEREFVVMQAFLRRVDVQASTDQTFEVWSEQVRKVAHEVEDVIDEYAYLVGKTKDSSIAKKTLNYVKNVTSWNEIANQIKEVIGHIDHLTQMRDRYGITIPQEGRNNANRLLNVSNYSHLVDENAMVGNMEERNQLFRWLTEMHQDRTIISIWGMGGSGKTTLIGNICKTEGIKRYFECFAFVTVSQSFQVEELLKSMMRQIFDREEKITADFGLMNHTNLLETLHTHLQNKRYLVVLDDVWKRDAWASVSRAFPKNNKGSRVVITTRNEDVAYLANEKFSFKMRALSKEEA